MPNRQYQCNCTTVKSRSLGRDPCGSMLGRRGGRRLPEVLGVGRERASSVPENMIEELRRDTRQGVAGGTEINHKRPTAPAALNHYPGRWHPGEYKIGAPSRTEAVAGDNDGEVLRHTRYTTARRRHSVTKSTSLAARVQSTTCERRSIWGNRNESRGRLEKPILSQYVRSTYADEERSPSRYACIDGWWVRVVLVGGTHTIQDKFGSQSTSPDQRRPWRTAAMRNIAR